MRLIGNSSLHLECNLLVSAIETSYTAIMHTDILKHFYQSKDNIIYENDAFLAYLDDKPVSPGHTLIITKHDNLSILDIGQEQQKALFVCIHHVHDILLKKYHFKGFNIALNEGAVSGKTMPILTLHFIPRYDHDVDNPLATGARAILGMYSEQAMLPKHLQMMNEKYTEEDLHIITQHVEEDTDKEFYLGLKALVRNEEGKVLALEKRSNNFVGTYDLPGGRVEHRDKKELQAVQREVYEEIGVYIQNVYHFDSFIFWDVAFKKDLPHPIGLILNLYTAHVPNDVTIILRKQEEFNGYKWVWPSELATMLEQYPKRIRENIRALEYRE